jgi:hypothetical protein
MNHMNEYAHGIVVKNHMCIYICNDKTNKNFTKTIPDLSSTKAKIKGGNIQVQSWLASKNNVVPLTPNPRSPAYKHLEDAGVGLIGLGRISIRWV